MLAGLIEDNTAGLFFLGADSVCAMMRIELANFSAIMSNIKPTGEGTCQREVQTHAIFGFLVLSIIDNE